MKSGPTLAAATRRPRRARAAMTPVATVVLPTPEWVPATTTLGASTGIRPAIVARQDWAVRVLSLLPSGTEIACLLGLKFPGGRDPRVRLAPERPVQAAGHPFAAA